METTLINHPRLRVTRRTGSEGPRHDPYRYEELHVTTPHNKIVLHQGLGCWMTVNDLERASFCGLSRLDENTRLAWYHEHQFPLFVGYTVKQIERIARRRSERCRKCGGREFQWVAGYPGEELCVCSKCEHINGSTFCRSAIE